jgi:NACHT domain
MTFDALHKKIMALPHTGPKGFEGFVSDLLCEVSGRRFSLFKSGPQGGVDSISEGHDNSLVIGMEGKQYKDTTKLPLDQLKSKIRDAAETYSTLDLWVLATTRAISAGDNKALIQTGDQLGLDVLVLDWVDNGAKLPFLAVLCAGAPQVTQQFLGNEKSLVADLEKVVASTMYSAALEQLSSRLTDPGTGYSSAASYLQNWTREQTGDKYAARVAFDSYATLTAPDTILVQRPAIDAELSQWWQSSSARPAVLLGNEGLGKTWAALGWAMQQASTQHNFPLTMVIPARNVDTSDGPTLLARELYKRTNVRDKDFWERRLLRWSHIVSDKPTILLVVDGLNQNWSYAGWSDLVTSLNVPRWRGKVAIIFTCRPDHWRNGLKSLGDLPADLVVRCIDVQPFHDEELDGLLANYNLERAAFQPSLLSLLRNPRLAKIAIERRDLLLDGGEITRERLIYEDWRHRQHGAKQALSHEGFIRFVAELGQVANEKLDEFTISRAEILIRLSAEGSQNAAEFVGVLGEMIDGGWFVKTDNPNRFSLSVDCLPSALALFALSELKKSHDAKGWDDILANLFDPMQGSDISVSILRFMGTFGIYDSTLPAGLVKWLLGKWVGAQNFSSADFQAFWRLIGCNPDVFIGLADADWLDRIGGLFSGEIIAKGFSNAWKFDNVSAALNLWLYTGFSRLWLDAFAGEMLGGVPDDERAASRRAYTTDKLERADKSGALDRFGLALTIVEPHNHPWWTYRAIEVLSWLPRAPLLNVFTVWAFTSAIVPQSRQLEVMAWVLRYNKDDPVEAEMAIIELTQKLLDDGAEVAKQAAEVLLSALATPKAMVLRNHSFPPKESPNDEALYWPEISRVTSDKDTLQVIRRLRQDPLDPLVTPPTNWSDSLGISVSSLAADQSQSLIDVFLDKVQFEGLVVARWAPEAFANLFRQRIDEITLMPEVVPLQDRLARMLLALQFWKPKVKEEFQLPKDLELLPGQLLILTDADLEPWRHVTRLAFARAVPIPIPLSLAGLGGSTAKVQIEILESTDLSGGLPKWCNRILVRPEDSDWETLAKVLENACSDAEILAWLGYIHLTAQNSIPRGWEPLWRLLQHETPSIKASVFKLIVRSKNSALADKLAETGWSYQAGMDLDEACWGSLALNLSTAAKAHNVVERIHPNAIGDLVHLYPERGDYFESYANYVKSEIEYHHNAVSRHYPRNLLRGIGGWEQLIAKLPDDFKSWMKPILDPKSRHVGHWFSFLEDFPLRRGLDEIEKLVPGSKAALVTKELRESEGSSMRYGELYAQGLTLPGPYGEEARQLVLAEANNDEKLFSFVQGLQEHFQTDWLVDQIKRDLMGPTAGVIARGVTLAGFMLPNKHAEALWAGLLSKSPTNGWIEDVYERSKANYERYKWSQHWFREFHSAMDNDKAFAAYELFLATVDMRLHAAYERPDLKDLLAWEWRRQHHWSFGWERLQSIIKANHKELEKTFLLSAQPLQNQWPRKK